MSSYAAFRAEWLCLSGDTSFKSFREAEPREKCLGCKPGKAEPYRTEGGRAEVEG